MSLDVSLEDEDGQELYSANITHNLADMARAAGIYMCLWRPEEIGITRAGEVIGPLATGLADLATNQAKYEAYNASNGWGMWKHFVPFCAAYLQACRDHPQARVMVCR